MSLNLCSDCVLLAYLPARQAKASSADCTKYACGSFARKPCSNKKLGYFSRNLTQNPGLLILLILFSLNGCITIYNPATEKKEVIFINTKSEISLGKDISKQIQSRLKVLKDPQKQFRLDYIGQKIAKSSDRQDLTYQFKIIADKELNAFAIPGGFVYVNSGLMDNATDDELAGVLGHEIGHIAARHSVKKLQTSLGYQIIMNIAMGVSKNKSLGNATDIIFNLVNLGYSRKDEFLADKLAAKYTQKSGFNPYGIITFFYKLKREAESKGTNYKLVFLNSHPPIEERIKNIKKEITLLIK